MRDSVCSCEYFVECLCVGLKVSVWWQLFMRVCEWESKREWMCLQISLTLFGRESKNDGEF